jgi:hypothetical protein
MRVVREIGASTTKAYARLTRTLEFDARRRKDFALEISGLQTCALLQVVGARIGALS